MKFNCKNCGIFEIEDNKVKGYWNFKCPKCNMIAVKEGFNFGGVIWKCDAGTVKRTKIKRKKRKKK